MQLDAVQLELLYHKLKATTEEMGIALSRTARSTYVKETQDFATALVNAQGKFFAYPAVTGVSGSVDLDCRNLIAAVPDLKPGDVLVTNHPYLAGGVASHLPDLNLFKPYFHDGKIVCYGWSFVHCSDMGGGVPSSISPAFDNLFQEGFMVPPMKLVEEGKVNESFMQLFRANTRIPDVNDGDLQAQFTALAVGERRVAEIIAQHGIETFMAAQTGLPEYARQRALVVQKRIPDGEYVFWDYMDDDFHTAIPVRLRVKMTVKSGQINIDLTGTDPQMAAAYNVPTGGLRHPWFTTKMMHFLYTYDPQMPLNYGMFENITITVPKGTIFNPEAPAAVGVRHVTGIRLSDCLVGCLGKAMSGLAPAAAGGTVIPAVVAQTVPETGRRLVTVIQAVAGGAGAGPKTDGADGRDRSLANLMSAPTERGETDVKVRIEEYSMRADSGGPGRHRGGTGVVYSIRVLRDGTEILGRGLERFVFQPWGIEGGAPGQPARVVLNLGTPEERDLGKIAVVRAKEGDLLTVMTPGGGGYGDPFTRPVADVLRDVQLGFVSRAAAKSDYGVVFKAGAEAVDEAATAALRAGRTETTGFGFGKARLAWETVFDDASMTRLAVALLNVPSAVRNTVRTGLFEAVIPGVTGQGPAALLVPGFDAAAARARLAVVIEQLEGRWSKRAA